MKNKAPKMGSPYRPWDSPLYSYNNIYFPALIFHYTHLHIHTPTHTRTHTHTTHTCTHARTHANKAKPMAAMRNIAIAAQ